MKTTAPPLCHFQSLVLLCVLPFTNIGAFLWCYTALPLHFLDSKWPIWQLSLLLTLIYVPRLLVQIITRRVGGWFCVPCSCVAVACNVNLYFSPNNILAVSFALTTTCSALNPTAYKGFMHARFFIAPPLPAAEEEATTTANPMPLSPPAATTHTTNTTINTTTANDIYDTKRTLKSTQHVVRLSLNVVLVTPCQTLSRHLSVQYMRNPALVFLSLANNLLN